MLCVCVLAPHTIAIFELFEQFALQRPAMLWINYTAEGVKHSNSNRLFSTRKLNTTKLVHFEQFFAHFC